MDRLAGNGKSIKRVSRVLQLLKFVEQNSGPLEADDLAAKLHVSHRTLIRDVSFLRASGFKIELADDRDVITS